MAPQAPVPRWQGRLLPAAVLNRSACIACPRTVAAAIMPGVMSRMPLRLTCAGVMGTFIRTVTRAATLMTRIPPVHVRRRIGLCHADGLAVADGLFKGLRPVPCASRMILVVEFSTPRKDCRSAAGMHSRKTEKTGEPPSTVDSNRKSPSPGSAPERSVARSRAPRCPCWL